MRNLQFFPHDPWTLLDLVRSVDGPSMLCSIWRSASGVNARGIGGRRGGFLLKSEFAKETEKGRDAPLEVIRALTKRASEPRWSNGVTFGIITIAEEEGSRRSSSSSSRSGGLSMTAYSSPAYSKEI